jgi:hypothetical protein
MKRYVIIVDVEHDNDGREVAHTQIHGPRGETISEPTFSIHESAKKDAVCRALIAASSVCGKWND